MHCRAGSVKKTGGREESGNVEEDDQQLFKKAGGKEYTFKCEVSDSFGQTRRAVLPAGEKVSVGVCVGGRTLHCCLVIGLGLSLERVLASNWPGCGLSCSAASLCMWDLFCSYSVCVGFVL